MADPQANPQPGAAKARGNAGAGATGEPRSFEPSPEERGQASHVRDAWPADAADALAQAAQPLVEGGRQMADQARRGSRQMAEAWRQAVDPLLGMQYDISQWFDDVFRQTFGFRAGPSAHPLRPMGQFSPASLFGLPPSELKETETAHVLAIELPGLTRQDVDISIDGDTLVVSGHKAEESEDAGTAYRVSERRYGRFERAFPLPPDVDRGHIEARFRDGLLKITLPKTPSAAPQRARIEIAD
jgi:HSP20 family protein